MSILSERDPFFSGTDPASTSTTNLGGNTGFDEQQVTDPAIRPEERQVGPLNFGSDEMLIPPRSLDPTSQRLAAAGLEGIMWDVISGNAEAGYFNWIGADNRARLSLSPGSGNLFYKDPSNQIMSPLRNTDGVLFPYTPTITVSHAAQYENIHPTHTNYMQHSYSKSGIDSLTITCDITANTQFEARYVLAIITFFRSVTKSFFGQDQLAGTPPPVLRFNAHGQHMFSNLPVVVSNYTTDFPADQDYIQIQGTTTMIPTFMTLSIQLFPMISKKRQMDFSLDKFSKGYLVGNRNGSGGFI